MGKKTASLWSLGEPFFLGLSCLVGGEQFYILLYGTGRSVRAQSFVLVFTAIITCIMSAAISSRTEVLAHFFHLFYMSVLLLLILIGNEITGRVTATLITIGLGCALTVLVIQSCSLYSTSREELLSFILGMLSARYLPCFLRIFLRKGCTFDSKIRNLSSGLGLTRLVFCVTSLIIKVIMGRFQLIYKRPTIDIVQKTVQPCSQSQSNSQQNNTLLSIVQKIPENWEKIFKEANDFPQKSLIQGFKQIWNHKKYLVDTKIIDEAKPDNLYIRYLIPIFKILPIITFLNSVFMFLMYPKTRFSAYCSYSPRVISILMNVKFVSHIIGSLAGIGYPVSVTSNSALFPTITFFFYYLVVHYFLLPHWDRYFTEPSLYVIVGASSFILGYMSSYSLGLIINMVLRETCVYEEIETFDKTKFFNEGGGIKMKKTCCGEKITSKCYCKLEEIFDFLDLKYCGRTFVCSTLFVANGNNNKQNNFIQKCNNNKEISYTYSKYGKCAILLICNSDGSKCEEMIEQCKKECQCSSGCKGDCCLKVVGIYKLDGVSVSSCEECQLTVRLEGDCVDPDKCTTFSCSNGKCDCNNGNCCCICVKCCTTGCGEDSTCCCIGFCNKDCNQCCCKKNNKNYYLRLFICYKTNGNKCCIKEIRPNEGGNFMGDLKIKNQFDIQNIFISNCCHVGVRIDLRCAVKNNYFRSEANYPRKFEKPDLVSLFWSEGVCYPKEAKCCCMFSQLVRGYIMFLEPTVKHTIEIGYEITGICQTGSKCCLKPCYLQVDDSGGFVKRVDRIRVKLVVISWLFFGLVFFLVVLIASMFRSKYSPVTFYPMTSYSKLAGKFATNKYNSNDKVTARILSLSVKGQITSQTIEAKKVELKAMLGMFAKYSSIQETKKTKKRKPKEVEKIHKYITSQATSFSPSSSIGGRACELCVVEWSQCVGLVYKYVMPLFFFIQNFFIGWEKAWKIDFYNYKKQMMPYVTKVTHNSNISLTNVMSEVNVGDKSNEAGLNRLMTWNGTSKETKQLSQVKMEEDNMRTESIPPKIGKRLCYYVRRWNHRLYNIRNWCKFESHLFDWAKFLHEYYKIREWVTDVSPGLRCDSEVKVSTKDLNKGIKIFIATM